MHGCLQTSRTGRVRYPPLAFWMSETKVHDKHGGAIAITRPTAPARSALPLPPKAAKPQPASQAGPAKRSHSTRQQTSAAQQAVASHSAGKPAFAPHCASPTQPHSKGIAAGPAHAAKAQASAASPTRGKQQPAGAPEPARSALCRQQRDAVTQDSQGTASLDLGSAPTSTQRPGMDLSAANVAVAACADPAAAAAALAAAVATAGELGKGQLRACGSCKHCLRPSLRKACLVLKAFRTALGQIDARHSGRASQHSQAPKAGKACQSPGKAAVAEGSVKASQPAGKAAKPAGTGAVEGQPGKALPPKAVGIAPSAGRSVKPANQRAVSTAADSAQTQSRSRKRPRPEEDCAADDTSIDGLSHGQAATASQEYDSSSESSEASGQHRRLAGQVGGKRSVKVHVANRSRTYRQPASGQDAAKSSKQKCRNQNDKAASKQAVPSSSKGKSAKAKAEGKKPGSKGTRQASGLGTEEDHASMSDDAVPSLSKQQVSCAAGKKARTASAKSGAQASTPERGVARTGPESEERQAAEALQSLSRSPQRQLPQSEASLQSDRTQTEASEAAASHHRHSSLPEANPAEALQQPHQVKAALGPHSAGQNS